jgi:hypothetical protein
VYIKGYEMKTISGKVEEFGLQGKKRKYLVVSLPFKEAKDIFSAERYRAGTGAGEQRELVMTHVKSIRKEIEDGNFTPTSVSVGVRENVEVVNKENGQAEVTICDGVTLPLLDGGHRFAALDLLYTKDEHKEDIGNSTVTALVMLDGNTKKDFLNLQKGRPVDKSHIHSLSIEEKLVSSKDVEVLTLAYETAKLLNANEQSPFYKQIRFDSCGVSGIPIATLSGKGASDIATSLVGGARIALQGGKNAEWLAKCITIAYSFLKEKSKSLLEVGMKLCPPPQGTKGSATMLIGVGNLLAFRAIMRGVEFPEVTDVDKLCLSALKTLDGQIKGNFAGPTKRTSMGNFAEDFLADLVNESNNHYGLPKKLIEVLSPSTFAVPVLPKEKVVKVKPEKKVKVKKKDKEEDVELLEPVTETLQENDNQIFSTEEKAPWEDEGQG